ncbi:mycofactocin system glycosyltransferase [Streptomyces rapamycinicus]|uniref:Mycofactocin system glycosyltransferase n=1 Tax=Streptomyces rhizosphaericus TaxID=114699 RepID=A0A6G4AJX4_9ACTN|nr:mycofactocin system glycosyltransferase [Streptomyces rhizosphaericus]
MPIGRPRKTAAPHGRRAPLPAGTRLVPDDSLRRFDGGRVLLGGSPLRLLRLRRDAAGRVEDWLDGRPTDGDRAEGALARRLIDAGMLHPLPGASALGPADVTLVVPVRDNPEGVARLLAATTGLATRIVVDDGSVVPLPQATHRHRAPAGPAAARNTGWRQVTSSLVAFLDSDTIPEPGWLESVLPLFTDPEVLAVAPRVRSLPGPGALSRYEAERSSLDLGHRPAAVRPMSRVGYVPSAALVIRRTALSAVDGFDESLRFGEDVDLVWRLIATGGTVRYQPQATVWHQPRPTLRAWLRQRFAYGTSAAPLALRHPENLRCASLSPFSAAVWALLMTGRPLGGLSLAAATSALLPRKLRGHAIPVGTAFGLAARGHLGAGRILADATRRAWWPLALSGKTGRRALIAALLPCLIEGCSYGHELDPARWTALRIADDLAYGAGVWTGCLRHHVMTPLLPRLTNWPGRTP